MSMTVGELVAFLRLDDKQFTKGLANSERDLGKMGTGMQEKGKSMAMGMTLPLAAVGALAVKSAATFETSMNQVQAASGASASEMDKLSQYAKDMGAATVFSAGEAADAILELTKSGLTPAQVEAGALKATMDLAAAGGLELADAATVTSNAMNTFGLEAKDATAVAAALAGGANASSADVSDLSQALSQVGPGAKTAGLSLQETVAVLAEFADKGIRGSDAGTSLKTMLTRLVPTTDKAANTMKQLGIDFTNADGSMKSISEIADILQDKLGGLSEEQQTLAMNTLFGNDATRAATILMQGGAEGLEKYTDATNDQSAATEMAESRMKGMGGAIENMKGSLETASITIGEVLAPGITKAADGIKWLADVFSGLPKWAQIGVVGIGAFLAALGPVLIVVGKIATGLAAIKNFKVGRSIAGGAGGTDAAASTNVSRLGGASATSAAQVAGLGRSASIASGGAGKLGGATATATGQVGTMGTKAQTVAPQLTTVGTSAKNASPRVGGLGGAAATARGKVGKFTTAMGGSAVGAIGASLAFSAALGFTIPKVIEAGQAFMSWMDALDTLEKNRESRKGASSKLGDTIRERYGSYSAYLKHLRDTYGKDSPQYKNAIAAMRLNEPKKPTRGRPIPNALGGDYMVTRPTLFLAGEAGPERATFTPKGKAAPGGGAVFNNCTFVAQDPRALVADVTRGVRRELALVAGTGF